MDKKRLFIAMGFIAVCVVVAYAIYFVFFKKELATLPVGTIPSTSGEFPAVGEGKTPGQTIRPGDTLPESSTKPTVTGSVGTGSQTTQQTRPTISQKPLLTKVIETPALGLSPVSSGKGIRFYNQQDGKFYHVDSHGKVTPLDDTVFYNVENVTWSPKRDESIIEYPDGANIYYNFDTGEQVTLPKHWEDFTFSNEGTQIAAKSMGLDTDNRWLITSDPTGNSIQLIESLGENADKVTVGWSANRQVVALSRTGQALGSSQEEVLLVGLNHENFKSIIVEGRGLQSQWSPEGNKLLHSVYSGRSDYKPELWIVDGTPDNAGANRKMLNINTWANKCTMSDERFAYCGVPDTLDTGAGFAPEIANNTQDRLYKIDTTTGIKTEIPLDGYYTIDRVYASEDGTTLYFTDKNQNGIFQVAI